MSIQTCTKLRCLYRIVSLKGSIHTKERYRLLSHHHLDVSEHREIQQLVIIDPFYWYEIQKKQLKLNLEDFTKNSYLRWYSTGESNQEFQTNELLEAHFFTKINRNFIIFTFNVFFRSRCVLIAFIWCHIRIKFVQKFA